MSKIDIDKFICNLFATGAFPAGSKERAYVENALQDCGLEYYGGEIVERKKEPKFKVGDWIVQGCNILKIRCVGDEYYCFETIGGYIDDMLVSEIDSLYHLWSIEDAKDGDVLMSGDIIFIFNKIHGVWVNCHCSLRKDGSFKDRDYDLMYVKYSKEVYPATKEQRKLLFQKMYEDGYIFNFEKKELKKLKFRIDDEVITENGESLTITKIDEDGYWSNDLFLCDFDSECVLDLVKWSKEDDIHQRDAIYAAENIYTDKCGKEELVDWLKSLKNRINGMTKI